LARRSVCSHALGVIGVPGLGAGCKDKEAQAALAEMKAQAELEGISASGNKMGISGLIILRVKDGLIVEEVEEADMLGLNL